MPKSTRPRHPCPARHPHRLLRHAALALLAGMLSAPALADTSFNLGAVSDYRYRGISQTRMKPALQGGADWVQGKEGGSYAGTWLSTLQWIKDIPGGGNAPVEWDVYGGRKGSLSGDLGYDVGALAYVYLNNRLNPNANTLEVHGALTWGATTAKLSLALTNLFGNPDSKGSTYLDLSHAWSIHDGWTLTPHLGWQNVRGPVGSQASYVDGSVTVSKDFNGLVPSLSLVATSADRNFYQPGANAQSTRFLGRTGVVLGLKWAF